jgi:hypothetical protein
MPDDQVQPRTSHRRAHRRSAPSARPARSGPPGRPRQSRGAQAARSTGRAPAQRADRDAGSSPDTAEVVQQLRSDADAGRLRACRGPESLSGARSRCCSTSYRHVTLDGNTVPSPGTPATRGRLHDRASGRPPGIK